MTLREAIDRLDEFADAETIYAESMHPTARAVVSTEPQEGSVPCVATGLAYLLEVSAARDAIEVWRTWRPGQLPTLDDKLAAVTYYAQRTTPGCRSSSDPDISSPAGVGAAR